MISRSPRVRILVFKVLCAFTAFDLAGFGRNFPRLHKTVSRWRVARREPPVDICALVSRAVDSASCWYPKRIRCLQRSAVTVCLLRDFGVQAYMVVGAQKLPFKAHAWVEVDGVVLNEKAEVQRTYAVWDRC